MQSPDGNQLWCPSQSLWSLIAEHVTEAELPKIRAALGHSLFDMYTDVHSEAVMWHNMWQETHDGGRAGTALPRQQGSPLADPPAIKELVRAEVKMLLQTLRERGGRDAERLVFRYKPETVDYALDHPDSCYRNSSNSLEDTDDGSRPSSHCSVQSSAEDEIEAMVDNLNVTDIEQVVDRLKSVVLEECETLKRLVKHIRGNIKQKRRGPCVKPEPTLAELRELRGAIQTDLELYPSSFAALLPTSSPVPLKERKNRFRLSAGSSVSDETLQALSTTSVPLRPHPPPTPCQTKPRPPSSAPPGKPSASVRHANSSSLSQTHGQHRSTSAFTGTWKAQTSICNRISSPGHANSHSTPSPPGPASDQLTVKTTRHCGLSPERDSAGLSCGTQTCGTSFQIRTARISAIHETHLSSHRSIHGSGGKCDLSPQTERRSGPAWRSRNINTVASSPLCDAGTYSGSSTDHTVSPTGKSKTQRITCGGSLVSTTVSADNDRRQSTSESFHSCVGRRKGNDGTDRNKSRHIGRDVAQQQSLVTTVRQLAPHII